MAGILPNNQVGYGPYSPQGIFASGVTIPGSYAWPQSYAQQGGFGPQQLQQLQQLLQIIPQQIQQLQQTIQFLPQHIAQLVVQTLAQSQASSPVGFAGGPFQPVQTAGTHLPGVQPGFLM